jgi:signal transduction histidine kinase
MLHYFLARATILTLAAVILSGAQTPIWADVAPKRVLMLQSFGFRFKPWTDFAEAFRFELNRQSTVPIDFDDQSLFIARLTNDKSDIPFVAYLHSLYSEKAPDLIVALGAPAANFVQRYRSRIFPTTPMLFYAVEARRVEYDTLTDNDTVAAAAHDFPLAFETILQTLPRTKVIAVINGASPNEVFWQAVFERELAPLSQRVELRWYNRLSFEEILKEAANLPPDSAIFWHLLSVDAAGVSHEASSALSRLSSAANAPIFSYLDLFFGASILGGSMHSLQEGSAVAAAAAIRILNGEKAGDIKTPPTRFKPPRFDWRQMQRWGIVERNLPAGSEVFFREPTMWQRYFWEMVSISTVVVLQALLIAALLYEDRRRRRSEANAHVLLAELTHMNRIATAGQLTGSIAHEIRQPLAAIAALGAAGINWLKHKTPDLDEVRGALDNMVKQVHRANEVITSVTALVKKEPTARRRVDLNELVQQVLTSAARAIDSNKIALETNFIGRSRLMVMVDPVQIRQVILNLIMNAIEAMSGSEYWGRMLRIETSVDQTGSAVITVADSGPGFDAKAAEELFKPFFTTKSSGMGLGLSICKSIVEAHGGQLTVASNEPRGAVFRVELRRAAA